MKTIATLATLTVSLGLAGAAACILNTSISDTGKSLLTFLCVAGICAAISLRKTVKA